MVSRRKFIQGSIVAIPILGAGCIDDAIDGQSTPDPSGGLSSRPEYTPASRSSQASESTPTSEPTPDTRAERQEVFELYNDGISKANDGMQEREEGVRASNNENYPASKSHFEAAEEHYIEARDYFRDAIEATYQIDNEEARDICETAEEYATIRRSAMRASQRMVDAAADGDFARANNIMDDVRDLENEAERLSVRNPSTLMTVLDLD